MWAHVDETYAREAFERLALCLRLVSDSDPTADPASPLSEPRCASIRRSARLLAKARRVGIATATAVYRPPEFEEECGAGSAEACGNALASPPGKGSHDPRNGVLCDVSVTDGVDKRGREANNSGGTINDDGVLLHGGVRCQGFGCWVFVAIALFLSLWLVTTPDNTKCDGRRAASGGFVRRDCCPAFFTDFVVPAGGPTVSGVGSVDPV